MITDKAWNQSGYEGINLAKQKLGAQTAYVEKVAQADQTEVLTDFARKGYNLIFAHGGQFDAIAIAFLSRGSVVGVVLTSLFFAALRSGANVMQRSAGVPVTVVYAIQGLTVLFIAISLAVEREIRVKYE